MDITNNAHLFTMLRIRKHAQRVRLGGRMWTPTLTGEKKAWSTATRSPHTCFPCLECQHLQWVGKLLSMGRTNVNTYNVTMIQKTTTTIHSPQSKTSSLGQNVNTDNNWDAENNHKKLMTNLFSMVTVLTLTKSGMQRTSATVNRLLTPTVSMMQSNNNSYI